MADGWIEGPFRRVMQVIVGNVAFATGQTGDVRRTPL